MPIDEIPTLPALTNVRLERDPDPRIRDGYWLRWEGARTIEFQYWVGECLETRGTSGQAWVSSNEARARAREATPTGPTFGPWSEWVTAAERSVEPTMLADVVLPGGKRIVITSDRPSLSGLPPLSYVHVPSRSDLDAGSDSEPVPDLPALPDLRIEQDMAAEGLAWRAYWASDHRADVQYEVDGESRFMGSNSGDRIPRCDRLRLRAVERERRGPWSAWFTFTPTPANRPAPPCDCGCDPPPGCGRGADQRALPGRHVSHGPRTPRALACSGPRSVARRGDEVAPPRPRWARAAGCGGCA